MAIEIEFKLKVDDATVKEVTDALPHIEAIFARLEGVLPVLLAAQGVKDWLKKTFTKAKPDGSKPV
jgi:hypothetical protein